MNAVFFGLKRAHQSTLRITRPMLHAMGLTAARFDMLFVLLESPEGRGWTLGRRPGPNSGLLQSRLRKILGVSRPTVSRMLASLEELGILVRRRCELDRRQLREIALDRAGTAAASVLRALRGVSPDTERQLESASSRDPS